MVITFPNVGGPCPINWSPEEQKLRFPCKQVLSLDGTVSSHVFLACWPVLETSSLSAPTSHEPIPLKIYFNLHILLGLSPGEWRFIQAPGQKTPMQRAQEEHFPGIWAGGDAEPARNLGDGEKCSEVLETGVEKSRFEVKMAGFADRMRGWRKGRKPKGPWRLSVWARAGTAGGFWL